MKTKNMIWIGILIVSACSPMSTALIVDNDLVEIEPPVVENLVAEPQDLVFNPNTLDALAQKK